MANAGWGQVLQSNTAEEVAKALGAPLATLQEQIYTMKRQKVEALIHDKVLAQEAAKRGISVQALLDAEVTSNVGLVTEQEIETYYQANKARLHGEEATLLEQIRPSSRIRSWRRSGRPSCNPCAPRPPWWCTSRPRPSSAPRWPRMAPSPKDRQRRP
jgi:hypothetical protein